jgi:hypothetical protein
MGDFWGRKGLGGGCEGGGVVDVVYEDEAEESEERIGVGDVLDVGKGEGDVLVCESIAAGGYRAKKRVSCGGSVCASWI